MIRKEEARKEIEKLVEKYEVIANSNKLKTYNEEMTKKDFILPLFRALGWNIEDSSEVLAEEKISKGRVDYSFRINGMPKFFLEAKSLKTDLDKPVWSQQAINYAWLKGTTWAILSDFEGIKVFNSEVKTKRLSDSLFFEIRWNEYVSRFEQLWLLSKESLEQDPKTDS